MDKIQLQLVETKEVSKHLQKLWTRPSGNLAAWAPLLSH